MRSESGPAPNMRRSSRRVHVIRAGVRLQPTAAAAMYSQEQAEASDLRKQILNLKHELKQV